jgi:hypothetical protein
MSQAIGRNRLRVTTATEPTEARLTGVAWRTPRHPWQDACDSSRFIFLGASLPMFDPCLTP